MHSVISGKFFAEAFVTLLVITDPSGVIPLFLGLTSGHTSKARYRLAWQATAVSFGVIVGFALFGQTLLSYLGVELASLQGAGGLLLLLVALELLTGRSTDPTEAERIKTNVAFVPLGTPLLAGPGAIVATILFARRASGFADIVALGLAIVAVHAILWFSMRFALVVMRLLRPNGVELVTRIAGLLLSAIAVQLVADAVRTFIKEG